MKGSANKKLVMLKMTLWQSVMVKNFSAFCFANKQKNYQCGLSDNPNATVMWLLSSAYPAKRGPQIASSLTPIAALKKGKKKDRQRKHSAYRRNLSTQDRAIVSGELETTA